MGSRLVRFVKTRLKVNYDANRALPVNQPGCHGGIRAGVESDRNSVEQHDRLLIMALLFGLVVQLSR